MAIATRSRPVRDPAARADSPAQVGHAEPAALAAARVSRASLLIGALGVVSAIFVLARLLESWRITPHAAAHRISLFGQQLSYPVANSQAVILIALATLGLIVTVLALRGTAREIVANRRFHRRLAQQNPRPLRGALVIDDEQPQAFCAGLLRPRVYLSTGALQLLDESGLDAVLAHEWHHARRHDPLRLATGRVLARALFGLPGLKALIQRQQALAELSADESAINAAPGNRSGLAGAMLSFSDASSPNLSVGIDPTRIDYLLGDSPSWRFPLTLCLGTGALIVLVGRVAHGSATLAPPFLSSQPCVIVLAAIPASLGLLAAVCARRVWQRSEPGGEQGQRQQRDAG